MRQSQTGRDHDAGSKRKCRVLRVVAVGTAVWRLGLSVSATRCKRGERVM
jgi:hypothetical protein